MKRFNESEHDYQNWLLEYSVTDEVLKEIQQTYTELYEDLFNNPDNLSKNKDKWIIFNVNSNGFKDYFLEPTELSMTSIDGFTYTDFKLINHDDKNPVYEAIKTYTEDKNKRNSTEIYKHKGDTEKVKLPMSYLQKSYNDKYIKFDKEPVKQNYYIKITKDVREITHMSTDKGWTSCMSINIDDVGAYSDAIIESIKNGLLVAYLYKTTDFEKLDNSIKQFAEDAIARISINPYQSKSKFLYLKAMKTYATQKFHNEKPFDLKEVVQDYLDKHYNFGILDTEDIFYAHKDLYNDLALKAIKKSLDIFLMIDFNDISALETYIKDGKDINILNENNITPLTYALENHKKHLYDLLFSNGGTYELSNDTIMPVINYEIEKHGNNVDLNHLDISKISNLSGLFSYTEFNGDISKWDTSNVKTMESLFIESTFDGDISKWNTKNVINMSNMFRDCVFNGNISKWNVSSVKLMNGMFKGSGFSRDISKWNVKNVRSMDSMFNASLFNVDINKWKVNSSVNTNKMFDGCPLEENNNLPEWYSE